MFCHIFVRTGSEIGVFKVYFADVSDYNRLESVSQFTEQWIYPELCWKGKRIASQSGTRKLIVLISGGSVEKWKWTKGLASDMGSNLRPDFSIWVNKLIESSFLLCKKDNNDAPIQSWGLSEIMFANV